MDYQFKLIWNYGNDTLNDVLFYTLVNIQNFEVQIG